MVDERQFSEEHGDEPWLISYADMMTLLFGLFVMLFSYSQQTSSDFDLVRKSLSKSLGGAYVSKMSNMKAELEAAIKNSPFLAGTKVTETKDGLDITLQTTFLFEPAEATVVPEALPAISTVVGYLNEKGHQDLSVRIEGHTDDTPMSARAGRFPSNWDLSGARGAAIVRLFQEKGYTAKHLSFVGFGDTKPLFPNRDAQGNAIPENQAKNRRVVIQVFREAP